MFGSCCCSDAAERGQVEFDFNGEHSPVLPSAASGASMTLLQQRPTLSKEVLLKNAHDDPSPLGCFPLEAALQSGSALDQGQTGAQRAQVPARALTEEDEWLLNMFATKARKGCPCVYLGNSESTWGTRVTAHYIL